MWESFFFHQTASTVGHHSIKWYIKNTLQGDACEDENIINTLHVQEQPWQGGSASRWKFWCTLTKLQHYNCSNFIWLKGFGKQREWKMYICLISFLRYTRSFWGTGERRKYLFSGLYEDESFWSFVQNFWWTKNPMFRYDSIFQQWPYEPFDLLR